MKTTILPAAAALMAVSCYRYPSEENRWKDEIVATRYDEEANFPSYHTFAIATEVDHIEGGDAGVEPLPDSMSEPLIATVRSELKARGYKEVKVEDNPDLGAKIIVRDGVVITVDYYSYWGWYGYYYPYYPYSVPYYSAYQNWLVTVDLIDLNKIGEVTPHLVRDGGLNIRPDGGVEPEDGGIPVQPKLRAAWTGAVYGLVDKITADEVKEASDGISQAFKQSPYLEAK
jgi:hypothetical protein